MQNDTRDNDLARALREGAALFRGGFLAVPRVDLEAAGGPLLEVVSDRFVSRAVGEWGLLVAPGTPVVHRAADGTDVVAIGDVFDNAGGTVEDRLDEIARSEDLVPTLARMDLGGRHAVLIFRGSDLLAFNDPFGSRSVTFRTDGRAGIASHPELLAEVHGRGRAGDVAAYIASPQYRTRMVRYLPGNRTAFEGVARLVPNHLVSAREGRMIRFWPHADRVEGTEERMWDRFDAALDALRRYVTERYAPIVAVTGGLDTRSIVANFHRNGTPFHGVTWVNFNFQSAERETVDRIVAISGQPHFDVASPPRDKAGALPELGDWNSGRIGMNASRGVMMERYLRKAEANGPLPKPPCFVMGYGGEIVRGFYRLERRDDPRPFDAEMMLQMFGTKGQSGGNDRAMSGFIARSFRDFYRDADCGPGNLRGYHPADLFYWEHRMGMWAALTMETIDPAMHCLVGINSRRLYEAGLDLPDRLRLSKEVMHRYILARAPEIGAVPVV